MKKTVRIGKMHIYDHKRSNIFCKIEVKEEKEVKSLSISGVIGPRSSGNADGGCGQIDMEFEHRNPKDNDKRYTSPVLAKDIDFAPGWNITKWFDFLDVWQKWHMNNTKPNCEHQTGEAWDSKKEVTIYYFRLTESTAEFKKNTINRAKEYIKEGKTFTPTPEETKVSLLEDKISWHQAELPKAITPYYEPNGPRYSGDHYNKPFEVKTAGWVTQSEHPDGILSKPCLVCGYKYGSEWRSQQLPVDVIEFLESLPETDVTPAWC